MEKDNIIRIENYSDLKELIKMEKDILIKDNRTNKIIKFVYTNEDVYNLMLSRFREWEKLNKIEIIPQDINHFLETGVKV